MGEILFVRHGQANSQARNEVDYDRLSDLGRQQAAWLGDHLRAHEAPFDTILTGTLQRQIQTAAAMGDLGARPTTDPRLNEMDYFTLGRALEQSHGVPMPSPDDFVLHAPLVLEAWHRAEIEGCESFASFETRVTGVLAEATQPGRRVLCVTSGGVIGMMMRALLNLDPRRVAHVLTPILNSSLHRVQVTPHGTLLSGFNATPHLDSPERAHARTTY
ncbi:MAG: histidine phosphatase family protein [Rhodobacter sp.]|nr:histidine phosphatase family protein [Rhodobacter sp.]